MRKYEQIVKCEKNSENGVTFYKKLHYIYEAIDVCMITTK